MTDFEQTKAAIMALPDDAEGVVYVDYITKDEDGNFVGNDLCKATALKSFVAHLEAERDKSVVLFAERIKREVGLSCPDPWRSQLIDRINSEVQAALKEKV